MRLIILFILTGLASCSHSVHLVNMTDFTPIKDLAQAKKIKTETKQHVILGFVTQTDYVDQARKNLISKCPNGSIQNVMTRYSTSHGFFSWYNKIHMEGYCSSK